MLANASTIRDRVAKAHALLSGDDDTPGAVDLLGEASNAMDTAAQLDESLSGVSGTLMDLVLFRPKDAAAELIDRLDAYDTNDAELDEIEQRLDLLYRLKRKYGDTVEDIIAFGQKCTGGTGTDPVLGAAARSTAGGKAAPVWSGARKRRRP